MSVSKGAWNGRERVEKGAKGVGNFNFQWEFQPPKAAGLWAWCGTRISALSWSLAVPVQFGAGLSFVPHRSLSRDGK